MDPYDSDSSGLEEDERGEYTETNVLLGFTTDAEAVDDSISHLGGWPTWLDPASPPPGAFAKCKVCNDPMLLLLQLNGDLPEHFPNDERWLYIFGCPRRVCNRKHGSMRALRSVKKHKISKPGNSSQHNAAEKKSPSSSNSTKEKGSQKPQQDIGASLFGVGPSSTSALGQSANANPFSTSTSSTSGGETNPFAPLPTPSSPPQNSQSSEAERLPESFADKVRVSSSSPQTPPSSAPQSSVPPLPWPEQSSFPPPYPQYFLDAEYETLSRPSTPTVPTSAQTGTMDDDKYDDGGGGGGRSAGGADSKDTFESSLDKAFLRFSTRLGHNPEQVLRYEFRGTPLLYSTTDAVAKSFPSSSSAAAVNAPHIKTASGTGGATTNKIPRCESCGRERVFEVQLVPHAITALEEGREGIGLGANDETGMEWGTVILGVCAANCGLDTEGLVGWREEWLGVQWEERSAGR